VFVSDFFDFSIYVDADEVSIERWYIERFRRLRDTAFRDPRSYFSRYATLTTPRPTVRRPASGPRSTGATSPRTSCRPGPVPI
jgi:pantothenate kinase